jgi:hypothetical protein
MNSDETRRITVLRRSGFVNTVRSRGGLEVEVDGFVVGTWDDATFSFTVSTEPHDIAFVMYAGSIGLGATFRSNLVTIGAGSQDLSFEVYAAGLLSYALKVRQLVD